MQESDYRLIQQLGIRYAAAVDECDYEAFASVFTVDGIWAISAGDQIGRAAIAAYAERAVGHLAGTQHLTSNFLVEPSEEGATMRSNFIATHLGTGEYEGQQFVVGGIYKDKIKQVDGEWLIARREIIMTFTQGDVAMLKLR